jgi:hypothetical protein
MHRWAAAVVGLGVGLAGAVAWPGAAALAAPTITVGPSGNLVDGQAVQVAVRGFPANVPIAIIECSPKATNEVGCDTRTLTYAVTGPKGGVNATFIVARDLLVSIPRPGTKVDCRKTHCIIGVGTFDEQTIGGTKIAFKPNSGLAPALKVNVTVNSAGTVDTTSHVATVGGTIKCNRASLVNISGEVDQLIPFFGVWAVSRSYLNINSVLCGAPGKSVPWSAKVGDLDSAQEGSLLIGYLPGDVKVDAYAYGHAGTSLASPQEVEKTVTLSAAP